MNKKEIAEIKKTLKADDNCIQKIRGCYVDANKEKVHEFAFCPGQVPQEEMDKYVGLFAKCLSGKLDKNLVNLEFCPGQVDNQFIWHALLESGLSDDTAGDMVDKIIASYPTVDNYLILFALCAYDIPGRASDGTEMEDMSTDVYRHVITCIVPVNLSKGTLTFQPDSPRGAGFHEKPQEWVMSQKPVAGILYPAFNDRQADTDMVLFYNGNPKRFETELIDDLLECRVPLTADSQKEAFNSIIKASLDDGCSMDCVLGIQDTIEDLASEPDNEGLVLDGGRLSSVLRESGVGSEGVNRVMDAYNEFMPDDGKTRKGISISNIIPDKLEIETQNAKIQVRAGRTDLVSTRVVDGVPSVVVTLSEYCSVNGVPVNFPKN